MAVALEVPGPIILIKDEPLDVIDLDEEKTPEEVIYEWHEKVRKELNKHIRPQNEAELLEKMAWYLEQLKFQAGDLQDPGTLQNVMVKHIKVIELAFKRLKAAKSDLLYLDLMEEIMTHFCNVVVENATQKKKTVSKKEMKKIMARSCRRIKCLLYHCLLNSQQRIQHVLIKMQIDPTSQPCRDILNHVYAHFITRIKQEQTDDGFCRGYIIFQKWKMVRKPSEADTMDKCLYTIYNHIPTDLQTHEIFRRIVKVSSGSIRDMTREYFAYIRAKEKDRDKREIVLDSMFENMELNVAESIDWKDPKDSEDFNNIYKRWEEEIKVFQDDEMEDIVIKEEVDEEVVPVSDENVETTSTVKVRELVVDDPDIAEISYHVKPKRCQKVRREIPPAVEDEQPAGPSTDWPMETAEESPVDVKTVPQTAPPIAEQKMAELIDDLNVSKSESGVARETESPNLFEESFERSTPSPTPSIATSTCQCQKNKQPSAPPHKMETETITKEDETECEPPESVIAAKETTVLPVTAKSLVNLGENGTAPTVLLVVDPQYFTNQSTNTGEVDSANYVLEVMKIVAAEEADKKLKPKPGGIKCTASTQTQTDTLENPRTESPSNLFLNLPTPPSEDQTPGNSGQGNGTEERNYHSSGEEDNGQYKNASHYYANFSPSNEEELSEPHMSASPEPQVEFSETHQEDLDAIVTDDYCSEETYDNTESVQVETDEFEFDSTIECGEQLDSSKVPAERMATPEPLSSSNVSIDVGTVVASLVDNCCAQLQENPTIVDEKPIKSVKISVTPLETMGSDGGWADRDLADILSGPVTKLNTNIVNPDENFDLFDSDFSSPAYEPLDSAEVADSFFPKKVPKKTDDKVIHEVVQPDPADSNGLKVKIKKVVFSDSSEGPARGARRGCHNGVPRSILKSTKAIETKVFGCNVNVLSFYKYNVPINDDRLLSTDVHVSMERLNAKRIERWLNLSNLIRNAKRKVDPLPKQEEMVRIDYKKELSPESKHTSLWNGGAHFTMVDSTLKPVDYLLPSQKGMLDNPTLGFEYPTNEDLAREEAARTLVGLNLSVGTEVKYSESPPPSVCPIPMSSAYSSYGRSNQEVPSPFIDDDSEFNVPLPEIPCSPIAEESLDIKDFALTCNSVDSFNGQIKIDCDSNFSTEDKKSPSLKRSFESSSIESCKSLIENFKEFSISELPKLEELDTTKLPLKKRKMSVAIEKTEEEDFEELLESSKKDIERLVEESKHEISYPATPMLSIAEVQEHEKLPRPFKTAAERKEIPPVDYDLLTNRIVTEQYNNHTYNNPTINYHMNTPFPFYQPCGPVAYIPLLPYSTTTFTTSNLMPEQRQPLNNRQMLLEPRETQNTVLPAITVNQQPPKPKRGRGRPRKQKIGV